MKSGSSQKILVYLLSIKRTLGVIIVVGLLVAIPVTLALNQRAQTLQQEAAEIGPTAFPTALPTITPLIQYAPTDFNKNGIQDTADYNMLLTCINNEAQCQLQIQDINGDGIVNSLDYQILLNTYLQQNSMQ